VGKSDILLGLGSGALLTRNNDPLRHTGFVTLGVWPTWRLTRVGLGTILSLRQALRFATETD
jgi:hypothetical protein